MSCKTNYDVCVEGAIPGARRFRVKLDENDFDDKF